MYTQLNATMQELLSVHAASLDTRAIIIDQGATPKGVEALKTYLPPGPWLIAVDEHTWEVAGAALAQALSAAGLPWARYDVPTPEGHDCPMCDDEAVEAYRAALIEGDFSAGIAVGSGTINDIVKLGATQADRLMACVGTAPSMNGYTSKIAAVLSEGVKTTVPSQAPVVVIADVDVMAMAPERMIASGLGDLLSKPVSNADWQLSATLNGTFHSAEAMKVIELGASMLDGVAPKLVARDRQACAGLTGSLMVSGLAMSIAGSSSPASGGEHLISHFIDMTAHAFDQPYDFHGCQVGVGTLTTAFFYEKLAALDPAKIDVAWRVSALHQWEDYDEILRLRFGKLYEAVTKHAKAGYPTPQELEARLNTLVERWDEVLTKVGQTLRPWRSIEAELVSANGPTRYKQLGVDRDRARRAIIHCKDIRNRYTILHLAWELGVLDQWADEALEHLYE